MPSLGEAPSGGAKTFWLLLGRLPKVTRCKSGTISSRYRSNGYVHPPYVAGRIALISDCNEYPNRDANPSARADTAARSSS